MRMGLKNLSWPKHSEFSKRQFLLNG